jgi:RNA polymerase-interacting CarD/CdnL/TRCF family regulator
MAEQHGMQPEHHAHVPEKEFYDRAVNRLNQALRNIEQLEEQMAKKLGRAPQPDRRKAPG